MSIIYSARRLHQFTRGELWAIIKNYRDNYNYQFTGEYRTLKKVEMINIILDFQNRYLIETRPYLTELIEEYKKKVDEKIEKEQRKQNIFLELKGEIERRRRKKEAAKIYNLLQEAQKNIEIFEEKEKERIIEEKKEEKEEKEPPKTIRGELRKIKDIGKWREIKQFVKGINQKTHYGIIRFFSEKLGVNKTYTLSFDFMERLKDFIYSDKITNIDSHTGSDADTVGFLVDAYDEYELQEKERKNTYSSGKGEFFPYICNIPYDFSRYGIYYSLPETEEEAKERYKNNCLYEAFAASGKFSEAELENLRKSTPLRNVPQSRLKEISRIMSTKIHLTKIKKSNSKKLNVLIFGKEHKKTVNIGLYEDHYFINEDLPISKKSLKNFEQGKGKIEDLETKRPLKTIRLFEFLIKNHYKYLKPFTLDNLIMATTNYDKVEDNLELHEVLEENCREMKRDCDRYKTKGERDNFFKYRAIRRPKYLVFFDTETSNEKFLKAFIICGIIYDLKTKQKKSISFIGEREEITKKFFEAIPAKSKLIAHNLGFDLVQLLDNIKLTQIIKKGSSIKSAEGIAKSKVLKFQDSYCLIPEPLRKFPKMFGLENTKEIMPYDLYTPENIKKRYIKIVEGFKHIKKSDKEQFMENLDKTFCICDEDGEPIIDLEGHTKDTLYFDILRYSKFYCLKDCEVLCDGYLKFREMIKKTAKLPKSSLLPHLDLNDFITISQLSDKFLIEHGCYNGIYAVSREIREFIQRSIVGGRVMCRDNEKQEVLDTKIQSLDAASLYPSAMSIIGFLKGKPKLIPEHMEKSEILKKDGFFVEIRITEIGQRFPFPLISIIDEEGIRKFTDNIEELERQTIYIDKIGLCELVKHHKIKFEILRGYYYDEGRNYKIQKIIKRIFNDRLKLKKAGNPCQIVYKLIMNSAYGKNIMKPIKTDTIIKYGEKELELYMSKNSSVVNYYEQNEEHYFINEQKTIEEHFSRPHVGAEILSMSKKIMNEVMCLCHKLKIGVFYTDTDSIHMEEEKIPLLAEEFKKIYKRELLGAEMGQFNTDFEFGQDKGTEPYAINSLYVGKKCYIEQVEYIKNSKTCTGYHIRMKGIGEHIINKHIEDKKNDFKTPFELYKHLYDGGQFTFNLLIDPSIVRLKLRPDFNYNKLSEAFGDTMTRTIKF